jgi:putative NADPH-quinone reductase
MPTQILLFHPDLGKSQANRALAEAAGKLPDVKISDMAALYPDPRLIDVDAEVERLLAADRLILQFPVQWYSTPPLLKAWQDVVLTRMYYLRAEEEGDRLRGLPVLVAATAGNVPEAYGPDGVNLFPLADLLYPLRATAKRCFWRWTEPFLLYRANKLTDEERAAAGRDYAARVTRFAKMERRSG